MKLYNVNFLEDLDITSNVILALLYYKREQKLCQTAIQNAFKISRKSVYNHLIKLQKAGYIDIKTIGKTGDKVEYKTILTKKTFAAYYYTTGQPKQESKKGKKVVPLPAWYVEYKNNLDIAEPSATITGNVEEMAKQLFGKDE